MSGSRTEAPQRYSTIVVVGGGCYGSYYVRQLDRAASAGALVADRILVVDRDAECAVARSRASEAEGQIPLQIVVRDWRDFFADYLAQAADHGRGRESRFGAAADAIVPSPLMPHLMGEWLVERARTRWSDRAVSTVPFEHVPDVPWERAGQEGTHYVSFATWTCPVNCIEPRICPHTRGPRSWSLPERLAEYRDAERDAGRHVEIAVLHCRHRAYGVGMFDTDEVVAADHRISDAADRGRAADIVIGTVSHCHGALTRLVIPAASEPNGSRQD